ncbi:MAG: hypothetical protein ACP6IU_05915 [Candidatus Asgardarchaeia archaeon]
MPKLRTARIEDLELIPQLYEGENYYFPFNPFVSIENLRFALKHNFIKLQNFTVALHHKRLVGWVFYQFFDYDIFTSKPYKTAIIRELHISDVCSFEDLGQLLIKTVLEKMRAKNIRILYVVINPKSLSKYKDLLKKYKFKRFNPKDVYRYVFKTKKELEASIVAN